MQTIEEQIKSKLAARQAKDYLRTLPKKDFSNLGQDLIDFSSNDYLGLARNKEFKNKIEKEYQRIQPLNGATGSRLISGNTQYCEILENQIAQFHQAESALIFNSGYNANVGICSCIAGSEDMILYDELSHASIRDGLRMSRAKTMAFKHNDLEDLRQKMAEARSNIFIIVESIYSMDGDAAPLVELAELSKENPHIALIVDEAHGVGVFGENGGGLVQELGLEKHIFARIITYGKAPGGHGAAIVGPAFLKKYLINYASSFIYTTALPLHALITIKMSYEMLSAHNFNQQLKAKIDLFLTNLSLAARSFFSESNSPIQSLVINGNKETKAVANVLNNNGFGVKAILFPTVPRGAERIRISLHLFNTDDQIIALAKCINQELKHA